MLAPGCSVNERGPAGATNAVVTRVVDGDTLDADISGRDERVRLIGINTPETVDPRRPVECFGKEASDRLKHLLPAGTAIRLERDIEERDAFGRLLAYVVTADGTFVNLEMVRGGYATTLSLRPNVAHQRSFRLAEQQARADGAGLWGSCPSP